MAQEKILRFFIIDENIILVRFDRKEFEVIDQLDTPSVAEEDEFKALWEKELNTEIPVLPRSSVQDGIVNYFVSKAVREYKARNGRSE